MPRFKQTGSTRRRTRFVTQCYLMVLALKRDEEVVGSGANWADADLRAADLAPLPPDARSDRRPEAPDRGGEPPARRRGLAARPAAAELPAGSRARAPAPAHPQSQRPVDGSDPLRHRPANPPARGAARSPQRDRRSEAAMLSPWRPLVPSPKTK